MTHPEIPWPADPATLPTDEHGNVIVGQFLVGPLYCYGDEPDAWGYYSSGELFGSFESLYDAVNEGALRDDYRGQI